VPEEREVNTLAARAIADQVMALMRDHEDDAHRGRPCPGNRASFVAYLAHCLGVRAHSHLWRYVGAVLEEYESRCPGFCPHHPRPEEEPHE
jgi:hypothetical protein